MQTKTCLFDASIRLGFVPGSCLPCEVLQTASGQRCRLIQMYLQTRPYGGMETSQSFRKGFRSSKSELTEPFLLRMGPLFIELVSSSVFGVSDTAVLVLSRVSRDLSDALSATDPFANSRSRILLRCDA